MYKRQGLTGSAGSGFAGAEAVGLGAGLEDVGVGLSVAKVMIEMHGGRIWAESTEGIGSTFSFLLPVDLKNEEAENTAPFIG